MLALFFRVVLQYNFVSHRQISSLQEMKLVLWLLLRFLGMLTWIMIMAICCAHGSTLSDEHPSFVLVYSMKEIEDGTPIPVLTDVDMNNTYQETVDLQKRNNNGTIKTEMLKNESVYLTINGKITNCIVTPTTTEIKLNSETKLLHIGRNELLLHYNSSYSLRPPTKKFYEVHLQTLIVTKYFHLYLFASPKVSKENDSLLCWLNGTGADKYRNWLVKFIKEDDQGHNKTVGFCIQEIMAQDNDIYYVDSEGKELEACVLKLPAEVQQQDAGKYSCSLHIRHMETKMLTLHGHEKVHVFKTSTPSAVIIATPIAFALFAIILIFACFKWRMSKKPKPRPYGLLAVRSQPQYKAIGEHSPRVVEKSEEEEHSFGDQGDVSSADKSGGSLSLESSRHSVKTGSPTRSPSDSL